MHVFEPRRLGGRQRRQGLPGLAEGRGERPGRRLAPAPLSAAARAAGDAVWQEGAATPSPLCPGRHGGVRSQRKVFKRLASDLNKGEQKTAPERLQRAVLGTEQRVGGLASRWSADQEWQTSSARARRPQTHTLASSSQSWACARHPVPLVTRRKAERVRSGPGRAVPQQTSSKALRTHATLPRHLCLQSGSQPPQVQRATHAA